ncbi:MAG: PfkB family carbohydrate kinase [Alphaproteobacteria bacterium]|nr:PfkB family carbohydrate kinase [Alphaproteobacteria bacterium]
MTGLCVTGYGSLDYAVTLAGFVEGNTTTLVNARDPSAWPRIGGCPAYVARAVVARTGSAGVVSWMGDNAEGRLYCQGLAADGIELSGIAMIDAARSPTALMVYQADGSCACLYDPALNGREQLTGSQLELIAGASHLCISVGPGHLTQDILEARSPDCRVYWLTKNDTAAFTPEVRQILSQKADVVFCNSAERVLVGNTRRDAIIVETRGRDGVAVHAPGTDMTVPVEAVAATDTTGAGDTFAGAYIAAEMDGVGDPVAACEQAVEAARIFLQNRLPGAPQ